MNIVSVHRYRGAATLHGVGNESVADAGRRFAIEMVYRQISRHQAGGC
jgi:hypothetical protein